MEAEDKDTFLKEFFSSHKNERKKKNGDVGNSAKKKKKVWLKVAEAIGKIV